MRKLSAFVQVTLNGYFADPQGDLSWAHRSDPEVQSFTEESSRSGGLLLFGRKTYEMMASFWPTPMALETNPVVARQMNDRLKVVFSRTLKRADWTNTTLLQGHLADEVRRLKQESPADMAILGSGSIVAQLADEGLIDEYQIMLNPIALGGGHTLFAGIRQKLDLKLVASRVFGNGNVLLNYRPA